MRLCLAEKQQYETEFQRMIQNHMSFPSIVIYVVFNEGWGQYEVNPSFHTVHF